MPSVHLKKSWRRPMFFSCTAICSLSFFRQIVCISDILKQGYPAWVWLAVHLSEFIWLPSVWCAETSMKTRGKPKGIKLCLKLLTTLKTVRFVTVLMTVIARYWYLCSVNKESYTYTVWTIVWRLYTKLLLLDVFKSIDEVAIVFAAESIVSTSQSCSANRRHRGIGRTEWKGRLSHVVCLFRQFGGKLDYIFMHWIFLDWKWDWQLT